MKVSIQMPAPARTRWLPHSWDCQIGKSIPFSLLDRKTSATLVDAEVTWDGLAVLLTFHVYDADASSLRYLTSVGFAPA